MVSQTYSFFNFNNYSGKFYFRDDRTPIMVPEADFKIEPILNAAINFTGFIITTPDGIKYYFGKNQNADGNIDATEITSPYTSAGGLSTGDVISSWYLNKIVSGDDQFSMALIYQSEKYSYYTISMYPIGMNDVTNKYCTLVKNYVNGVRLSQINSSNGIVKFMPGAVRTDLGDFVTKDIIDVVNTDSKVLDTIKVTNNVNLCKNYVLYHSYFTDPTSPLAADLYQGTIVTDTKRLRLDSIQELACDNSMRIPPHTFTYTTPSGSFAPRRLTFGQDHWGFYNGKIYNPTLIPTYSVNDFQVHAGADRESSWPECGYGALNKITYPTGGYTQFRFEPNDIWANFNYYNDSFIQSTSIGPQVGNVTPQQINLTTSSNRYKFILDYKTNQFGNSVGSATIAGLSVNKSNPHAELVIIPGAGPHTYTLNEYDMTITNQDWATVKISEVIPTHFQDNKVIGGLRIGSIKNYDAVTGKDSAINYNYHSGTQSNGVLYSRPTYVQVLRNDILKQVGYANFTHGNGCLTGTDDTHGIGFQLSPSSVRPMETTQGNHIGYNNVEVSRTGSGKNVYKYYGSNIWDFNLDDVCIRTVNTTACALTIPNYPAAPLPFEFTRGELRYESVYNQAGNIIKDVYYYPVFENNPVTTPAFISKYQQVTLYNLTTAKKTKMIVVSSIYPSVGGALTTIDSSFYESPYHRQVTRTVTTNSLGEKLETKIKYAFDFRIPNCEAISDCYQAYTTSYTNALNTFNTQINSCVSGGCNCKWPAFQSYRYAWSVARKAYITCRRTNFMDPVNGFKTAHDNAKLGADAELKPILELQDEYINAPIEVSNWKNGQLLSSNFSRFDYSTNPANKVYPNKSQAISLAAKSTSFAAAAVNSGGTSVVKDARYKDETTLKFLAGNQAEMTSKSGITISYLWGYNNTLPVAQVTGASSSQIAYTSFESINTGNLTYATAKTADISSPTGSYCYNLTSGTIQRAGLTSTSTYLLSYWYKTGATVSISGGTQSNIVSGPGKNGWVYTQMQFTGSTTLTLSGSGFIDEVRIYPIGAQMTTYTYNPLAGITSINDVNNQCSYYDYDSLSRLKNIRDQNRNITKNFFYNYALLPTSSPVLVGLVVNNGVVGVFDLTLVSKSTGQIFNYTIPSTPLGSISPNVPPDVYDIFITCNASNSCPRTVTFQLCSLLSSGSSAAFYNVSISSSTCRSITLN